MRLLGSFVLRRADAVRLLFAGQLKNLYLVTFYDARSATSLLHSYRSLLSGLGEPIILAAGFPLKVKGVDVLAKAFQRIAPKYPTWRLVLIGHQIPEELAACGIESPQIVALPGLLQSELAEWMSRCAILALVSRSEAMGRVLLEGAAAGKVPNSHESWGNPDDRRGRY